MALKVSEQGKHVFKVGAIIVRGGSIVSLAANLGRPTMWGTPNRGRHAEERAIKSRVDYSGATIYVARRDYRMSRPCNKCMAKIIESKISRIVYIDWDGSLKQLYPALDTIK